MATTGDLLMIEPQELQFPFEMRKQISCSLRLSNKTDSYVAFKVKTTNPKKYCVRPNTGIVLPGSTSDVVVTMQAQKEEPLDMQCKDKFLLQSVIAAPGATAKDISPQLFNKESGHDVEECKLRVVYVPPPRPVSPVREGSDEGSSPRASSSDNGNSNASEFTAVSRSYVDSHDNSFEDSRSIASRKASENDRRIRATLYTERSRLVSHKGKIDVYTRALISKLTDERNSAIQLHKQLQQELELLRRQTSNRGHGGDIPFMYVVLITLIAIILGYLMKRS